MSSDDVSPATAAWASVAPPQFGCELRNENRSAAWIGLSGELDLAAAPRLQETLQDVLGRAQLIILDLRQLTFIDSTGIHAVIDAHNRARGIGHRLVLIRGPRAVDRVFALTGVSERLDMVDLAPDLASAPRPEPRPPDADVTSSTSRGVRAPAVADRGGDDSAGAPGDARGPSPGTAPAGRSTSRPAARARPRGIRLLDVDPELAAGLEPAERARAQRLLVVPLLRPEPGGLDLDQLRNAEEVQGSLRAVMLVRGALELTLELAGRRCSRVVNPPEIVLLDPDPSGWLSTRAAWSAAAGTELAALDARFLTAGQRWPSLFDALLARAARQAHDAFVLQAISQLPRVEVRLLAYFWWLADRHGRVRPDGVVIERSFTHESLGQMIGAARPTVSLALKELAKAGLLRAEHPRGWLLTTNSLNALLTAGEPAGPPPNPRYEGRLAREIRGRAQRRSGRPRVLVLSCELALPPGADLDLMSVNDEPAALHELAREAPDLVLIDLREPSVQLSQLLQTLRDSSHLRMTRLVLLGHPTAGEPSIQLLAAAHEYIADPTDVSEILVRIKAQLALARARAAQADHDELRARTPQQARP